MAMQRLFVIAIALILFQSCANEEPGTSGTDQTSGAEETTTDPGIGTYEAFFVYRMEDGTRDTTSIARGSLSAPYATANMTEIDLAGSVERTSLSSAEHPLPYGMEDSAYLVTYVDDDGDRVLYATDPSTTRQLSADTANTVLHAFAIAPMWKTEAAEHSTQVIDRAEGDTVGVFSIAAPDMNATPSAIDGAAAAPHESVQLFVTVEWAGEAYPLGIAWRGYRGNWWAKLLEDDPRAIARPNTTFLKGGLAIFEEDAQIYLVPLDL